MPGRIMTDTANLTRHFDRIRIISLRRRTDRRSETVQEFARHGLAIDGDRVAFFDAIEPPEAGGFSNPAVRGCFLSHLAVLEQALEAGARNVLVIEDDIAFARGFSRLASEALRQLEAQPWDLAYLGHAQDSQVGPPAWLPVAGPMLHAHCYAVNGPALEGLVDFLKRMLARPPGHPDGGPMHYDGALSTWMAQTPTLCARYFSRNLGYQRPSRTDLHPPSLLDRHALLMPVRWLYRRLKRGWWHLTR